MAKFVSAISLALLVVFFLGGCATQEGGRYDWVNLEKHKKPPEKKEVAKKPGLFDWLKRKPEEKKEATEEARRYESPRPEEKKEVAEKPGRFDWLETEPEEEKEAAKEARRYKWREPEETKEIARKPGRFDWLKTEPEEEKEAAEEPSRYEAPRPEEKKEAAEKPGRFDWLETEPEEEKEAAEEPSRYEAPKPEEKKEIAEKPGRFDWLKTEPEEEKEEVEKPERYDWLETEPEKEKEAPEKPKPYDWATREPGEEEERAPLSEPGDLDLKLDYWMADGKQSFSIASMGWKVSELEWWGDANFLVLTGEYRLWERWSVDASYGTADFKGWDNYDTDWYIGIPIPFSISHSDSEGEGYFWMVDLYYRFWTDNVSFLDAFLGYQYNENSFRDTNLVQIIPPTGPHSDPSLNATYEIEYQGVRLGLRGETPLTSNPEWTLEGSIAYLPWVEAESEAYWVFRDMPFTQTGGEGDGIDAFVAVNYRPHRCPNLTLELGYRYMELETTGGITKAYDPMGYWETEWHDTKCKFNGFFFGLAYRF